MKKSLLTVFAGLLSVGVANAQCTPDPALAASPFGLYPDSLATVYTCDGCGDASRVVDFVTFTDTTLEVEVIPGSPSEVTIYIDAFKILEVRNVPGDMTYGNDIPTDDPSVDPVEAPWGIWFNGGDPPNQTTTQGCVYINGSEDAWMTLADGGLGMVQLEIDVDARIVGSDPDISSVIQNGSWLSDVPADFGGGVITVDDYWLVAQQSALSVTEVDQDAFAIVNTYPNPVVDVTNINFNAPKNMNNIQFEVYSILGTKVHTQQISADRGMNNIRFDGSALSSGLYVFTLSDGNTTLTRKMTVK